ncbi:hypothetical protein SRHO_G00065410 [Serrasalmus rhombeus]
MKPAGDGQRKSIQKNVSRNLTLQLGLLAPLALVKKKEFVLTEQGGIMDRHAVRNSVPLLDEQQDYELVYLTEAYGQTVMKFRQSISACDENDYPITFTVPAQNSHYHCKVMRNPALDRKYHIYRVEPLIDNLDLVHHLLLYRCPPTVTSPKEQACYTEEAQAECYQTVAA